MTRISLDPDEVATLARDMRAVGEEYRLLASQLVAELDTPSMPSNVSYLVELGSEEVALQLLQLSIELLEGSRGLDWRGQRVRDDVSSATASLSARAEDVFGRQACCCDCNYDTRQQLVLGSEPAADKGWLADLGAAGLLDARLGYIGLIDRATAADSATTDPGSAVTIDIATPGAYASLGTQPDSAATINLGTPGAYAQLDAQPESAATINLGTPDAYAALGTRPDSALPINVAMPDPYAQLGDKPDSAVIINVAMPDPYAQLGDKHDSPLTIGSETPDPSAGLGTPTDSAFKFTPAMPPEYAGIGQPWSLPSWSPLGTDYNTLLGPPAVPFASDSANMLSGQVEANMLLPQLLHSIYRVPSFASILLSSP